MSALSRSLVAIAVVLGTAFVLVRLELAGADWERCFHGYQYPSPYLVSDVWPIVLRVLTQPDMAKLIFVAPIMPTLLVIALARRWGLPILAIAPLAFLIASVAPVDVASMHDCDRKGPHGAGAFLWMLFIQLPLGTLLLVGLGVRRLFEALRPATPGGAAQP